MKGRYASYQRLNVETLADGVLGITLDGPGRMNAVDATMHGELASIWRDVDDDPEIAVAVVTGAGEAFSAGGDFDLLDELAADNAARVAALHDARGLVRNMLDCSKPVVSAINGPAIGAGLACALLADIPIAAREALIIDGHARLGVVAGDHAAIIWPLLCGIAKAKYYLLSGEPMTGEEAERIGLVALAVDRADLAATATEVATRLARGSAGAIRGTKYVLNHWLRAMGPTFDASLGLELLGF
ncbi:MAG: enoyl-CoA hydratase/isomerase family protein, partial [Gaiellales bacterium]